MTKFIDITGNRYGRLLVKNVTKINGKTSWVCQCDCGNTKTVLSFSLETGRTKSCGCLRKEVSKTNATVHGDFINGTNSLLYNVWASMKQRCSNPNNEHYINYGSRGISVCSSWQEFVPFKEWSLANGYALNLQIDRKNNNKGYSPDNCRWVTNSINARNKRSFKGASSQYVGVGFHKASNKWYAKLKLPNKDEHIGIYPTEFEAAKARDTYIIENNLEGYVINL